MSPLIGRRPAAEAVHPDIERLQADIMVGKTAHIIIAQKRAVPCDQEHNRPAILGGQLGQSRDNTVVALMALARIEASNTQQRELVTQAEIRRRHWAWRAVRAPAGEGTC